MYECQSLALEARALRETRSHSSSTPEHGGRAGRIAHGAFGYERIAIPTGGRERLEIGRYDLWPALASELEAAWRTATGNLSHSRKQVRYRGSCGNIGTAYRRVATVVLWALCDMATASAFAANEAGIAGMVVINPWVHSGAGAARGNPSTLLRGPRRNIGILAEAYSGRDRRRRGVDSTLEDVDARSSIEDPTPALR